MSSSLLGDLHIPLVNSFISPWPCSGAFDGYCTFHGTHPTGYNHRTYNIPPHTASASENTSPRSALQKKNEEKISPPLRLHQSLLAGKLPDQDSTTSPPTPRRPHRHNPRATFVSPAPPTPTPKIPRIEEPVYNHRTLEYRTVLLQLHIDLRCQNATFPLPERCWCFVSRVVGARQATDWGVYLVFLCRGRGVDGDGRRTGPAKIICGEVHGFVDAFGL